MKKQLIGITVSLATKGMLRQAQHDKLEVAPETVMSMVLGYRFGELEMDA